MDIGTLYTAYQIYKYANEAYSTYEKLLYGYTIVSTTANFIPYISGSSGEEKINIIMMKEEDEWVILD